MNGQPYTVVSPVFLNGVEQFGVACNFPDERSNADGTLHCTHGNIIAVSCSDVRAFEICEAMNERAQKQRAERERQQAAAQTPTTK